MSWEFPFTNQARGCSSRIFTVLDWVKHVFFSSGWRFLSSWNLQLNDQDTELGGYSGLPRVPRRQNQGWWSHPLRGSHQGILFAGRDSSPQNLVVYQFIMILLFSSQPYLYNIFKQRGFFQVFDISDSAEVFVIVRSCKVAIGESVRSSLPSRWVLPKLVWVKHFWVNMMWMDVSPITMFGLYTTDVPYFGCAKPSYKWDVLPVLQHGLAKPLVVHPSDKLPESTKKDRTLRSKPGWLGFRDHSWPQGSDSPNTHTKIL